MNYYEHHIGDYIKDTAHLSMLEDSAYRRLIDAYLFSEKPIPVNPDEAFKIAGAKTRKEKEVVKSILDEFFNIQQDGWHHWWCDAEIERERKKQASLKDLRERDEYRKHRDFVLERDGFTCVYCGATNTPLQLDHVFPRSRGGSDDPENLVACCRPCNASKGAKTPDEWVKKS